MKPHKNVNIKLNDNMLPHYRIARKLQVQCLLFDGESGAKVEPWLKIHFSKSQITHSRNQLLPWISKAFSSGWFNLKPKTNLCIESSQRQNFGYRIRATLVHPESQSWLNQRNYLSLRESLHWLESTSVRVGLHLYSISFVCLY